MVGYYGWQGRHFAPDSVDPQAAAICSRCGFKFALDSMSWQYDFRGGPTVENTRILICGRSSCQDIPNPQISPSILSADPEPIFNARPEPYEVDETNWLVTDDDSILSTSDDTEFITSQPNPASSASASQLACRLSYPSGSVAVAYLDLFNGNPLTTGTSVLSAITGSDQRVSVSSNLTTVNGVAENTSSFGITSVSLATINVSYVGIYDSPMGGMLLTSGPVSASPSITVGAGVQFDALALSISLL